MNVKSLISDASVLDDVSAWEFLAPHLQDSYHVGLWNFASKIATRLERYDFLAKFYTLFLKDNPDNVNIKFKLLDSLLKSRQYENFLNYLQDIQTENSLSEELIEKIYARFAGQINKEFSEFNDKMILLLLDGIKNLRETCDTAFTQKIFNGFIKNILAKDYADKKNYVLLEHCLPFANEYHIKQLIKIATDFVKYDLPLEASVLLKKISLDAPFSVGAFMYGVILSHKYKEYNFIVTSWLDFLAEYSKTESQMLAYALCLMQCEDFTKAHHVLTEAFALYPDSEDIIVQYADTLFWMDRFKEAENFISLHKHKIKKLTSKIFQLEAQIALATYNVPHLKEIIQDAQKYNLGRGYIIKILLALGKIESAYALYHASEAIEELYTVFPDKQFPFHILKENPNQPIKGKLVILSSILGLGDEIRFSCFLPALAKICTNVKIICDERLYAFRKRQFKNISFIPLDNVTLNPHHPLAQSKYFTKTFNDDIYRLVQDADYVAIFPQFLEPLLTYNKVSLKSQQTLKPLFSSKNYWKKWLETLPNKPKIGLFWRSDLYKYTYSHKKTHLKDWIDTLKDLPIAIVPLQYGLTADEKNLMAEYPSLFFIPPALDTKNDIENLAGLITGLDYVVTTAGTTQHLAGALGAKVLMCTHTYEAYWRCDLNTKKDRFAPNIDVIFGEPHTGLRGSIVLTTEKLKYYLAL